MRYNSVSTCPAQSSSAQTSRIHQPASIAAAQFTKNADHDNPSDSPVLISGSTVDRHEQALVSLVHRVEGRLVGATWTLRRMPDREKGFLHMRTMLWPEAAADTGTYAPQDMTTLQARRNVRLTPLEIDQMQPALDLLQLLPDLADRKLLFWASWHQDGELQVKIPWAKVRRSMDSNLSRWTMKRRYDNGLRWLASIILAQR